ncbi:hypothetical protein [Rhodospirillum sp. A1_3_36]|uniref:hypothetical protein n=1 Tax=Rhodospirillum sp. A1_3_36 TaxID=3391666 RepID=UPI0039A6B534
MDLVREVMKTGNRLIAEARAAERPETETVATQGDKQEKLTQWEGRAIQNRLTEAFRPDELKPVIMANGEPAWVAVFVHVKPDGTVLSAKAKMEPRFKDNTAYQAFVARAEQAVENASPLPIPKDKYSVFSKGFTVRFYSPDGSK